MTKENKKIIWRAVSATAVITPTRPNDKTDEEYTDHIAGGEDFVDLIRPLICSSRQGERKRDDIPADCLPGRLRLPLVW